MLAGYAYYKKIENVKVYGTVKGSPTSDVSYVGGLIGDADYSEIEGCYSEVNVDFTNLYKGAKKVGGLVGYCRDGSIKNSASIGTVNAPKINKYYSEDVGGLVGGNTSISTITNSYSTGEVTGCKNVGGLVGRNTGVSTITNSYSIGEVTGDTYVGGLVGENSSSTITNSYSTGKVRGNSDVGGLAGRNISSSTITNSYAISRVVGSTLVGGFTGGGRNVSTTVTNCYWCPELAGVETSYDGTPLTVDQMKLQTSYEGWDFDKIWTMKEYPELRF